MIAFWKYDLYPYCLHGKVDRVHENGLVYIKSFTGWFKPIVILPDEEGEKIAAELDILRRVYQDKNQLLQEEYDRKAKEVAGFIFDSN